MNNKISFLADVQDNANLISPEMCLISELQDVRKGPPDKLIVLKLWDSDNRYLTGFSQSGMRCSEMIALLEVMKRRIITIMDVDSAERQENN